MNRKFEVAAGLRAIAINEGRLVLDEGERFVVSPREAARLSGLVSSGTLIDLGDSSDEVSYLVDGDTRALSAPSFDPDLFSAVRLTTEQQVPDGAMGTYDATPWSEEAQGWTNGDSWSFLAFDHVMDMTKAHTLWVDLTPGEGRTSNPDVYSLTDDYDGSWYGLDALPFAGTTRQRVAHLIGPGLQTDWASAASDGATHPMMDIPPGFVIHAVAISEGDTRTSFFANGVPVKSNGAVVMFDDLLYRETPIVTIEPSGYSESAYRMNGQSASPVVTGDQRALVHPDMGLAWESDEDADFLAIDDWNVSVTKPGLYCVHVSLTWEVSISGRVLEAVLYDQRGHDRREIVYAAPGDFSQLKVAFHDMLRTPDFFGASSPAGVFNLSLRWLPLGGAATSGLPNPQVNYEIIRTHKVKGF